VVFRASAHRFNSSRFRLRRAIFCFRSRWNLLLSPLIPDIIRSCFFRLVDEQVKMPVSGLSYPVLPKHEKDGSGTLAGTKGTPLDLSIAKAQGARAAVSSRLSNSSIPCLRTRDRNIPSGDAVKPILLVSANDCSHFRRIRRNHGKAPFANQLAYRVICVYYTCVR
jgi:hypothetical protein